VGRQRRTLLRTLNVPPILDVEASGFGRFRLESLQALLTDSEIALWPELKEQVATALGLPRHRARPGSRCGPRR
jgi:hypothetical protein